MKDGINWRILGLACAMTVQPTSAISEDIMRFNPSQVDPHIVRFDEANVVIDPDGLPASAPLFVFLPGTAGRPSNVTALLRVAARQGYRVIGLEYDDTPAVEQVCPQSPDLACSDKFRRSRVLGGDGVVVSTAPSAAIVSRLTMTLRSLASANPSHWSTYLQDGRPEWTRIMLGGFSQGAGMAAWLAKRVPLYRVVLFSGPWDTAGPGRLPAPWLSGNSVTPMSRWWAARHRQEATTDFLAHAYAALGVPSAQTILFNNPIAPGSISRSDNPYHGSTVRRLDNAPLWRRMLGTGANSTNSVEGYVDPKAGH